MQYDRSTLHSRLRVPWQVHTVVQVVVAPEDAKKLPEACGRHSPKLDVMVPFGIVYAVIPDVER